MVSPSVRCSPIEMEMDEFADSSHPVSHGDIGHLSFFLMNSFIFCLFGFFLGAFWSFQGQEMDIATPLIDW